MSGFWNEEAAALFDRAVARVEQRDTGSLTASEIYALMQQEVARIICEDQADYVGHELRQRTLAARGAVNNLKRL